MKTCRDCKNFQNGSCIIASNQNLERPFDDGIMDVQPDKCGRFEQEEFAANSIV